MHNYQYVKKKTTLVEKGDNVHEPMGNVGGGKLERVRWKCYKQKALLKRKRMYFTSSSGRLDTAEQRQQKLPKMQQRERERISFNHTKHILMSITGNTLKPETFPSQTEARCKNTSTSILLKGK